jgi:hypothetical protein
MLTERIGAEHLKQIHPRFEDHDGIRVLVVECWSGQEPAYLQHDGQKALYVREGSTTIELSDEQAETFIGKRFARMIPQVIAPAPAENAPTEKEEKPERHEIRERFWTQLLEKSKGLTDLHASITPLGYNWIGATIKGIHFNYAVREHDAQAEIYIDFGKNSEEDNTRLFEALLADRETIEEVFGGPLEWEPLEGRKACRIRKVVNGGGWRDEPSWPGVHDELIDTMIRLEGAFRPHLTLAGH